MNITDTSLIEVTAQVPATEWNTAMTTPAMTDVSFWDTLSTFLHSIVNIIVN